jgi:SAM-dependent methyltransferase
MSPRLPIPRAWDTAWEGTPSWETGSSQPVLERLLAEGVIRGSVLDVGCGSGRGSVRLATAGHRVAGIDVAHTAIKRARSNAREALLGDRLTFVVGDALELDRYAVALGAPFDTVLDVGLFHVLQPEDRKPYARQLASVVAPGGQAFVVAWSERNPFGYGPGRIRRGDLRRTFTHATGWRVDTIDEAVLASRLSPDGAHAWLLRATRG